MMRLSARSRRALTLAATYVAAGLGGYVAYVLHIPLPWMVGAMLAATLISLGANTPPPPRLARLGGQITIGASVGLNLTPDALQSIVQSAVPILVSALLTIAIGTVIGLLQARIMRTDRATAIFSTVPGGPEEMAVAAQSYGGTGGPVALAQTFRLMSIIIVFPQIILLIGREFDALPPVDVPWSDPLGPVAVIVLALAGGLLARQVRLLNPFFLGAVLAVGALTASGVSLPHLPPVVLAVAQIALGVSLGSMFRRDLIAQGVRLMVTILVTTTLLIALCSVIALFWVAVLGADLAQMLLSNAPGSVTEMAITAAATHLNVPLVAAFHITRIMLILLLLPALMWSLGVGRRSVGG